MGKPQAAPPVHFEAVSGATHDAVLEQVCSELAATETIYPGTDLRLHFEPIRSSQIPRAQESRAW
jgi:hypothetical protein